MGQFSLYMASIMSKMLQEYVKNMAFIGVGFSENKNMMLQLLSPEVK